MTAAAASAADTEARALRRTLGQYATGVAVVTAHQAGHSFGMTINSFSAVSLDPPLVSWAIRRSSARLPHFVSAEHFAINVLAQDQVIVSKQFATGEATFEDGSWDAGAGGAPLLRGAIARIECVRECVYEGGDHQIILGRVVAHTTQDGRPLVFSQGRYAVTQEFAEPAAAPGAACSSNAAGWDSSVPLMPLLRRAHQRLSNSLEVHRRELDLTVISARVLSLLGERAVAAADLERGANTDALALGDALVELMRQRCIESSGAAYVITEEGRHRRAALTGRARELYAACFSRYSLEEKAMFTKMLKHLCDFEFEVAVNTQGQR